MTLSGAGRTEEVHGFAARDESEAGKRRSSSTGALSNRIAAAGQRNFPLKVRTRDSSSEGWILVFCTRPPLQVLSLGRVVSGCFDLRGLACQQVRNWGWDRLEH